MSKYWVYIDDKVAGPYTVDQLIRLRGFSRQARICSQEGDEGPQSWTSPANIPELSHIFKAVDETRPVMLPPRAKAKPPLAKARPRPAPEAPAAPVREQKHAFSWAGLALLLLMGALAAGGYFLWQQNVLHGLEKERLSAKQLVENAMVNTAAGAVPFKQYLAEKNIQPRWEYERQPTDLYNVSVIWFESGPNSVPSSIVNAFEVNLEAQTVRPLNSAAAKLFSNNSAAAAHKAPAPEKPKTPDFKDALADWQAAVQNGDFETVWGTFSDRKILDMSKGGISHSGFVRLQTLTHKLEAGNQLNVLKMKSEGNDSRLVLLKQSQKGQSDVFIRQYWVLENGVWKLDDEQKKAATSSGSAESESESAPSAESSTTAAKPPIASLPGISH
jgi:hypothetical protein